MYNETVMKHFKNPTNAGDMECVDGCGKVGNPSCGDVMMVQIKVDDGKITDAKFKTFGCCAAIAASDAVCEIVKGKTLEEAAALTKDDIVKFLGDLPCVKIHCSILGIEGLQKAIEDHKARTASTV